jgi:DNA processing protein
MILYNFFMHLNLQGSFNLDDYQKRIGIVGTRNISSYGLRFIEDLLGRMKHLNIIILSGFMYGVDITAHEVCVKNNIPTVGVLPCGLNADFMSSKNILREVMLKKGGGFISSFDPGFTPKKWSFIKRNSVLVDLVDTLIVVEAGIPSGSLNSAKWALKKAKPLYVLPGNIYKQTSKGTNYLLTQKEAIPILNIDTLILELFDIHKDSLEFSLLTLLKTGPKNLLELRTVLNKSESELESSLEKLLKFGFIKKDNEFYFYVR